MADSGTGIDPDTDRCPDCGHLLNAECGCSCCDLIAQRAWAWVQHYYPRGASIQSIARQGFRAGWVARGGHDGVQ